MMRDASSTTREKSVGLEVFTRPKLLPPAEALRSASTPSETSLSRSRDTIDDGVSLIFQGVGLHQVGKTVDFKIAEISATVAENVHVPATLRTFPEGAVGTKAEGRGSQGVPRREYLDCIKMALSISMLPHN